LTSPLFDSHGIPEEDEGDISSYYYNQSMVNDMSLEVVDTITKSAASQRDFIEHWLTEMRTVVCPRILNRMNEITESWNVTKLSIRHQESFPNNVCQDEESNDLQAIEHCPLPFRNVLRLLIQADRSGLWPSTSPARQRVINLDTSTSTASNTTDESLAGGSFSVGRPVQSLNTPRGNALFADLVEAVFALEAEILPQRNASRMVAINRRASFLPHKDSGAGFGQSTSLIVGLGDYTGGELSIEGTVTDIRYTPVEFDGWNQLHWTLPFVGNRYSLVWFTPAEKE